MDKEYKFNLLIAYGYIKKIFRENDSYKVYRYLPINNPTSIHSLNDYVQMLCKFSKREIYSNFDKLFPKEELFTQLEKLERTKNTYGLEEEEFNPITTIWKSRNGDILVCEMSDSHLQNTWQLFAKDGSIQEVYDWYQQEYNGVFSDEISDNFYDFKSNPDDFFNSQSHQIQKQWKSTMRGLLAIKQEIKNRNLEY